MNHHLEALRQNIAKLAANDASFATSLLNQYDRRASLSPKQWAWVEKLAKRASKPVQPVEQIGSLAAIMALFARAGASLRRPAIILALPEGISIRLTIAGERARFPGSLNIVERGDEKRFFGRIKLDGSLDLRDDAPASLPAFLRAFAADPAGIAAAYGHATGACCFCSRTLTDERSLAVGYGEICSGHYGLPYPTRAEVRSGPALQLAA